MRRNIRSARAQISVNCAGGIENNASMTAAHPLRGRLDRSSISSNTLASVLYAAQTGTALPVSETVAVIAHHPTAVAGAEFIIASTAGVIGRAIDGPKSGGNFGIGLREADLVGEVAGEQVRMRPRGGNRTVVNKEDAVASGERDGTMGDDDDDSIASECSQRRDEIGLRGGIKRRGRFVE